ncbi:tumor necrosis factor receptor superfamily member 11B-like isoform X2 [Mya arenaria]|nr:tumor necrosis factor receptor superfamily member 11B-like isoform X2 [Mya arenaria]
MGCKMQVACCAFMLAVSTTGILEQLNDTHYPVDFQGETIHCKMCPPGTFWIKHCSQDGDNSQCQNCPDGRFKTDNNRAFYCRKCTECTENDQPSGVIVAEACTRSHDTKCGCKPGFWREESVGDCQEVSPCMPGHGVKKMANSHKDTTCERCVNGKTFSNISSEVMPCLNCSLCPERWVQRTPCNETQNTVCILKDEVEEDSVGGIVGVACGFILAVAILIVIIIALCRRERTNEVLQKLRSSWRYILSQEKHDDEEQASPLKRDRRRQGNHDDVEQANPLKRDRRRQENHDDVEQASPLKRDRRRQGNHDDVEQANPLKRDRRRQGNHDDVEQANPLKRDRRRQENHDDVEQASPLKRDRRRQENNNDEEQANPLQQGGTPDKSEVNISRHQLRHPPCFTL